MATYYLKEQNLTSNSINVIFNSINSDSKSNTIYAEGVDIDFLTYFLHRTITKLIVRDTEFPDLNIDFSASAKVEFSHCTFQNLTLTLNQSCEVTFSKKCKVSRELHISSSDYSVSLLSISDSFIESLTLNNLNINHLQISSKSEINVLHYRNSTEKKHAVAIMVNSGSKIKKGNISELNINILAVEEAILHNINFDNVIVHQRLTLISVNQSKIIFKNFEFGAGLKMLEINTSNDLHLDFYNLSIVAGNFQFRYKNNPKCITQIKHSFINSSIKFFSSEFETLPYISTIDSVFKELVIFERDSPENIEFYNTIFQNGILIPLNLSRLPKVTAVVKIHSSVWCLLKNQSLASNDKITALTYRKYEMLSYTNEIKKVKGNYEEKIVLWLNNKSNSHGLSWVKGLKFTFIVWAIFFTLYAWASYDFTHNYKIADLIFNYKVFYANAFKFLWLPQGIEDFTKTLTKSLKWYSTAFLVFSFIMGKIAIAYGIYQTISAFRKHGKI